MYTGHDHNFDSVIHPTEFVYNAPAEIACVDDDTCDFDEDYDLDAH